MIEEFLHSATLGDSQDINVRKHIVNTFIREVIYYPDKIIITLNFTDNYDQPELTSEHIENIEKQSESETAFPLPKSSNKFTSFPPEKQKGESQDSPFCFSRESTPFEPSHKRRLRAAICMVCAGHPNAL